MELTKLLYTRAEAANLLSISVRTLDYLREDNVCKTEYIKGKPLIRAEELQKLAKEESEQERLARRRRKARKQ